MYLHINIFRVYFRNLERWGEGGHNHTYEKSWGGGEHENTSGSV